jgi:hypothetical protein
MPRNKKNHTVNFIDEVWGELERMSVIRLSKKNVSRYIASLVYADRVKYLEQQHAKVQQASD